MQKLRKKALFNYFMTLAFVLLILQLLEENVVEIIHRSWARVRGSG